MYLWRGVDKVELTFGDRPNGVVRKLVNVNDHIFVSTSTFNLYHGEVSADNGSISSPALVLKRIEFTAVDIASNSDHLFVVNDEGFVLKINPGTLRVVDTIVLKEDIKFCSHG